MRVRDSARRVWSHDDYFVLGFASPISSKRLVLVSLQNHEGMQKGGGPFGTPRLLLSDRSPFEDRPEKGAYSCGGTTILSLPIVTIRKSSRRFCCQQASLCSVQTGRSSP